MLIIFSYSKTIYWNMFSIFADIFNAPGFYDPILDTETVAILMPRNSPKRRIDNAPKIQSSGGFGCLRLPMATCRIIFPE